MEVTSITLTPKQIIGNAEGTGLLTRMSAGYDYEDGKRTDKQTHIKYEVVCPDNLFEKIIVKVPGVKPVVTLEQLEQQRGKITIKFKNLTGKFYRKNSGEYALSCSAESAEVIA
jgi:hypothetical protein